MGLKFLWIIVNMYDCWILDCDLRWYGFIWVDRIEFLVLEFNCESGDVDVRGIFMLGIYFWKKRIWIGFFKRVI